MIRNNSTRAVRTFLFAAAFFFLASSGAVNAQSLELVSMDDPVYAFIERAKVAGWVGNVPEIRPYYQKYVRTLLNEIKAKNAAGKIELRDVDLAYIDAQLAVYDGKDRVRLLQSPPDLLRLSLDLGAGFDGAAPINRIGDSFVALNELLSIRIMLGERAFIGLNQYLQEEFSIWDVDPFPNFEEPVPNDNNFNIYNLEDGSSEENLKEYHDPGEKQFAWAGNQDNQFNLDLELAQLSFGRQALDWGPGLTSSLLLSSTAKPYEYLWLNIPIGTFGNFSWMTGFLQDMMPLQSADTGKKLLNIHRLELAPAEWLSFSLYESVVYSDRFELAYLNPLGLYFLNEVRLGDYDNKSGGFDLIFKFPKVQAYVSMFVDDWWAEKFLQLNAFKNTFGLMVGVETAELFPGLTIDGEFAYASHWLYTHRHFSETEHDHNTYTNYGTHLGAQMEPNSMVATLQSSYSIDPTKTAGLRLQWMLHGRGDVYTPPDYTEEAVLYGVEDYRDIAYSFLDGSLPQFPIESVFDITFSFDWAIPQWGMLLNSAYTIEIFSNKDNVAGDDSVDNILSLTFRFNAY